MKSKIFFFTILLFFYCSSFIYGQEETSKRNWTLDIGYARYNSNYLSSGSSMQVETASNFRFTANRVTGKHFMPGAYLGFTLYPLAGSSGLKKSPALSYGINIKYNLIHLFTDAENLRLSASAQGYIGGIFIVAPKSPTYNNSYLEYGAGLNVSYLLTRKFGIFAEYNIGKFHLTKLSGVATDNFKLRYGIIIKF
jgi:hypothetical protein